MRFVRFMSSPAGRVSRIVVGAALIVIGVLIGGPAGWIVGIVGLVPLIAGAANTCLVAPLFHAPLHGRGGAA